MGVFQVIERFIVGGEPIQQPLRPTPEAVEKAWNDHVNGPGRCPKCNQDGLRHKAEGPGSIIIACDFCSEAFYT
ncbi:hypothetical protein GE300_14865 [Rhodobacteraceae bacterium 2CG4]|uniref:Uncharacterized protein n=1 Tax=Halovulum marinum TaxID=2662447 RepID=A0A6L5Z2R9_9RHOB|nr:hypothetical protein [Halovulum marinum]MSU90881.1 hypothetical protein [Halovulum marinum]